MKIRVVAPIKNEEVLLPTFLKHYSRFCDSIVLWDNGSTDKTLEIARSHPKVEIKNFVSDGFDTHSVWHVLGETKKESDGIFDWCLFPDCDEFITSKIPGKEREVLETSKAHVLQPKGYCLVEVPGDSPLNIEIDLLKQRRHGYFSKVYSKPIVSRPGPYYRWGAGRHDLIDGAPDLILESCPELLLIHADTIGFDFWLKRKMRPISKTDRAWNWGTARWERPREDYDGIWLEEQAQAVDLDADLPISLFPQEPSIPKEA